MLHKLQHDQVPLEAFESHFPSDHGLAMRKSEVDETYESAVRSTMPVPCLIYSNAHITTSASHSVPGMLIKRPERIQESVSTICRIPFWKKLIMGGLIVGGAVCRTRIRPGFQKHAHRSGCSA